MIRVSAWRRYIKKKRINCSRVYDKDWKSQEIIQVICKPKDEAHPDRARIYLAASASHRSSYVGRCSHPQLTVFCTTEIFLVFVVGVKLPFCFTPVIFHCTQGLLQHQSTAAVSIINQKLTHWLKRRQQSCLVAIKIRQCYRRWSCHFAGAHHLETRCLGAIWWAAGSGAGPQLQELRSVPRVPPSAPAPPLPAELGYTFQCGNSAIS